MRKEPLRRNRDFVLLWSGEALSQLGSQASTVAFPLLVLSLTGSAAKAGVVGLAKCCRLRSLHFLRGWLRTASTVSA